jgi:hypothetical protein
MTTLLTVSVSTVVPSSRHIGSKSGVAVHGTRNGATHHPHVLKFPLTPLHRSTYRQTLHLATTDIHTNPPYFQSLANLDLGFSSLSPLSLKPPWGKHVRISSGLTNRRFLPKFLLFQHLSLWRTCKGGPIVRLASRYGMPPLATK